MKRYSRWSASLFLFNRHQQPLTFLVHRTTSDVSASKNNEQPSPAVFNNYTTPTHLSASPQKPPPYAPALWQPPPHQPRLSRPHPQHWHHSTHRCRQNHDHRAYALLLRLHPPH